MPPRPLLILLASLLVPATATRADDPPKPGAPVPSDPVFQALLADGSTAAGQIAGLDAGAGKLTLVGAEGEREIALDGLVKLTREGEGPPIPPEGSLVVFPDGDRLRAILNAAGEASLEVQPNAAGDAPVAVPLNAMLGLILAPQPEPRAQATLLDRLRSEKRASEILWLTNGERLAGGLLALGDKTIDFQGEAGRVPVDRSRVVALGFDPALVEYPRPKGIYLELTFTDGSRLGASDVRVERGELRGKTRFGVAVRAPLSRLARAHIRGGAVDYLAERRPAQASYVSYVGLHPERHARDATLDGRPLRLGGQAYDHGIGTRSRTILAYPLDGRARRFQALVGLDDGAGPLGSVIFRVLVDGRERFASPSLTARDAPRAVDVDVRGGKFLILITEFGERGDVQDDADWVEARLVR